MGRPPAAGLMAAGGTLGVRNGGGESFSLGGIRIAVGTIESFKNLIQVWISRWIRVARYIHNTFIVTILS